MNRIKRKILIKTIIANVFLTLIMTLTIIMIISCMAKLHKINEINERIEISISSEEAGNY